MAKVKSIIINFTNGDRFCYEAKNENEREIFKNIYGNLKHIREHKVPITSYVFGVVGLSIPAGRASAGDNPVGFCYGGRKNELVEILAGLFSNICIGSSDPETLFDDIMSVASNGLDKKLEEKKDPLK